MTQVSLFDAYVRRRLDAWGREFALHRDAEILGHKSKDMLQVLIEHKGEMPPRPTGWRPLLIPPTEMQIEDIVHGIALDAPLLASVLRAFYCGTGRQRVERLETARLLTGLEMGPRQYYAYHDLGFQRVAGSLAQISRAA
ncbi:hypothetical protein [Tahibacter harae]|uniref:Uncharacterized protein n=1 Tax=Tahibacter harae TaxID=2963937 RepID=A0ABT1QS49_9GAMM|nr:hypothetical protein [Tahibacter harae]MCQ4165125.1 hypothetical protein [Tahibacter harae]